MCVAFLRRWHRCRASIRCFGRFEMSDRIRMKGKMSESEREDSVRMSLVIPRALRIEIRRQAASRDLAMQREVARALTEAYGLEAGHGE